MITKDETLVGTVDRIERERNERVTRNVLRVALAGVVLLFVAAFCGCSSDGALLRYDNDNGPRGNERLQIVPWAGGGTPCAAPPAR